MKKTKKNSIPVKKFFITLGFTLLVIYIGTFIHHQVKDLPEELNYESAAFSLYDEDVTFLRDITINSEEEGQILKQEIFDAFQNVIQNAETFIVLDMFMFTDLGSGEGDFPPISRDLMLTLLNQMELYPDLNVWIISDHINTSYGSHEAARIRPLEEKGATVVYADLAPLQDPLPIYSSFYRMFLQWFEVGGEGWITNFFGEDEPKVSLSSYAKMLNTKGNHRKVLITEKEGIYTSANAHDPSGYHSNIGVRIEGPLLEALLEGERRVVNYTLGHDKDFPTPDQLMFREKNRENKLNGKIVTEGKVFHETIDMITDAKEGEALWLGMYLLSEGKVVNALEEASERGVAVRIILDPNQTSFGSEKPGIPNVAVTHRMNPDEQENLDIRWYNIDEEQYHSKILFRKGEESKVLLGSTNFTNRSFSENNLENNILIWGPEDTDFIKEVEEYFERLWENRDYEYTLDFEYYQDELSWFRRIGFRIQKILRLTTF